MFIYQFSVLLSERCSVEVLYKYVDRVEAMAGRKEEKIVNEMEGEDEVFPDDSDQEGDETPTVGSVKEYQWYRVEGIREVMMGEGKEPNVMMRLSRNGGKTEIWVTPIISRSLRFKWNAKSEDESIFFMSKGLKKSKKSIHEYYDFALRTVKKKMKRERNHDTRDTDENADDDDDVNNNDENEQSVSNKRTRTCAK